MLLAIANHSHGRRPSINSSWFLIIIIMVSVCHHHQPKSKTSTGGTSKGGDSFSVWVRLTAFHVLRDILRFEGRWYLGPRRLTAAAAPLPRRGWEPTRHDLFWSDCQIEQAEIAEEKTRACREGCHSRQDRRSFTDWARRAFDSSCARSFLSLGGLVHQEQCESLAFDSHVGDLGLRTRRCCRGWGCVRSRCVSMAWPNLRGEVRAPIEKDGRMLYCVSDLILSSSSLSYGRVRRNKGRYGGLSGSKILLRLHFSSYFSAISSSSFHHIQIEPNQHRWASQPHQSRTTHFD